MNNRIDKQNALRQTLDFLKSEEGKSHQSYFWSGWAGEQLKELLQDLNEVDPLITQLGEALTILVADVQDYEAWKRPCHALDVAREALTKYQEVKP